MGITKIHVVRHGEVDNPTGVLYGRQPGFHLTALGREMAECVADYFDGHDIRRVVSSPLERAIETATPTAGRHGLEVRTDARIIEADNKFEGINVNRNRLILAHPRYWSWYTNPFRPSWGEPYAEIAERFSAAIRDILSEVDDGEVVMVSHQLPIWILRSFIDRRRLAHDPRRRECSLCSVTTLTFSDKQLIAHDYAEPARELLAQAKDVTPGTSIAAENAG